VPCVHCDDTGWKPIERDGIRRVVRCECWRERVGQTRLADANIPKRYLHCTLANFTAYNESLERAHDLARRFVTEFPAARKGLFFEGEPGVGKTHLAVAALKEVVDKTHCAGLFYDVRELLKLIRSTYNPSTHTTEIDVLRPVMTAELLVLDDIGAEKTSEWVEETLNLIVNTRYNERRATIFTSNFKDIPDDTDFNSLVFRIGHRMRSRLHEMCEFQVLDGGDYRQLPSNGGVDDLKMLWTRRKEADKKRGGLPSRSTGQARASLRDREARDGKADLKWPGGRAGS
jgi:DNA replication protein DnaC